MVEWPKAAWIFVCCLTVFSCKPKPTGNVLLDLASLSHQASLERSRLDEITLTITGSNPPFKFQRTYPGDTREIELELEPGRDLQFKLETFQREDSESFINYQGSTELTLRPYSTTAVTLQVQPVGRAVGTVQAAFNLDLEFKSELYLVPINTDALIEKIPLALAGNRFSAVLPVGTYRLEGALTNNEITYTLPSVSDFPNHPAAHYVIEHGDKVENNLLFFRNAAETSDCFEGLFTPDRDGDGVPCHQDCNDANTSCNIDGVCFPNGHIQITNPCQICNHARNPDGYSPNTGALCRESNCTQAFCSDAGECIEPSGPACDDFFTCNNESNLCECTPGHTYCVSDDVGPASMNCHDDAQQYSKTNCEYQCATSVGLCIEDRPVTNLTAMSDSGAINLTWDAAETQLSEVHYQLLWTSPGAGWSTLANTTNNFFTLSPSAEGTYQFKVRASEANVSMSDSNVATITLDSSNPQVISTSPSNGTQNVENSPQLRINFSEPIHLASAPFNASGNIAPCNPSHKISLRKSNTDFCMPLVLQNSADQLSELVFELPDDFSLINGLTYILSAHHGITDLSGNELQQTHEIEFTVQNIGNALINKINLFAATETNGAIGDRIATTGICHTALSQTNAQQNCTNVFALLSYSNGDSIQSFPDLYNFSPNTSVWALGGEKIADTWSNLFLEDPQLFSTLGDALVFEPQSQEGIWYWWSGSKANGSYDEHNCNNWTSDNSSSDGIYGQSNKRNSNWISSDEGSCSSSKWLLCGCTNMGQ